MAPEPPSGSVSEPWVELIETIFFCVLALTLPTNASETRSGPLTLTDIMVPNNG